MRALIVSDQHLGWEKSEAAAFSSFLDVVESVDALYVLGDLLEMWRRDIVAPFIVARDQLRKIEKVEHRGIKVHVVAGNHDWHLIEMGDPDDYPSPWKVTEEIRVASGGLTFVLKHGHQYDPSTQNPQENEALCHTNDATGAAIAKAYDERPRITALRLSRLGGPRPPGVPTIPLAGSPALERLAKPGLRDQPDKVDVVRTRARASRKDGEFLIHGHTHVPHLEPFYADSGAWVGGQRTYLLVDGATVEVKTYAPATGKPSWARGR